MIKLQTDFHLSTIIEKRGRCPGGRANILGGRFISLSVVIQPAYSMTMCALPNLFGSARVICGIGNISPNERSCYMLDCVIKRHCLFHNGNPIRTFFYAVKRND